MSCDKMDKRKSKAANSKNTNGKLDPKLLATLKKKKECEKKALSIVEKLIDGLLEEDELLNELHLINACHYEDIVEERFITKLCGYPKCGQQLTYIPTQQYKISIDQNKVYDITERKKFCSNICYKSSKYLQNQLLTSPLWLRDTEVIPKFKLLKNSETKTSKEIKSSSSNQSEDKKEISLMKLEEKISELTI